jgi:hypothetical protein
MTLTTITNALSSIGGYTVDKWFSPKNITIVALGQDASYYPNPSTEMIKFSTADEALLVTVGSYINGVFTDAEGNTSDANYKVWHAISFDEIMSLDASVVRGPSGTFISK